MWNGAYIVYEVNNRLRIFGLSTTNELTSGDEWLGFTLRWAGPDFYWLAIGLLLYRHFGLCRIENFTKKFRLSLARARPRAWDLLNKWKSLVWARPNSTYLHSTKKCFLSVSVSPDAHVRQVAYEGRGPDHDEAMWVSGRVTRSYSYDQGCQIFLGTWYRKKVPNYCKTY
jgi:hypothetical protein